MLLLDLTDSNSLRLTHASVPPRFLLHRESNINFYVAEASTPLITTVRTLDDIGPEFNFTVKVSSVPVQ